MECSKFNRARYATISSFMCSFVLVVTGNDQTTVSPDILAFRLFA